MVRDPSLKGRRGSGSGRTASARQGLGGRQQDSAAPKERVGEWHIQDGISAWCGIHHGNAEEDPVAGDQCAPATATTRKSPKRVHGVPKASARHRRKSPPLLLERGRDNTDVAAAGQRSG